MKTLTFTVNTYLGMDCMFCSHDEFEHFEVELSDEDAAKIEAAVEIFKLGAQYWMKVYQDLNKEQLLPYGDLDFIRNIASYISRGMLPSDAQCKRLVKIVTKAEDKGYIMP